MKDFEALKSIWQDQLEMPKISHGDVLKKIRKDRNSLASKLLLEMLGMGIATSVLGYVWIASPFRMWTTHLAMVIFLFCCLYYIVNLIQTYRRISFVKFMDTPESYIVFFKKYRQDRYEFNTRKYRNYSLFLTLGFILYFIEIAFLAELWITLLGILVTTFWITLCYFYLMRIYIRKEETKLGNMIKELERLQNQFADKS